MLGTPGEWEWIKGCFPSFLTLSHSLHQFHLVRALKFLMSCSFSGPLLTQNLQGMM